MTGKLIVFEGVSGTGKETQAKLLQQHLTKKRVVSHIVYHPSPELKDIMKSWRASRGSDNLSDVYLLLADRAHWVRKTILPSLEKGQWIISLRSWVSALVYQGNTKEERAFIEHEFHHIEPVPDYLFYFDITPKQALERVTKRFKETGEALGTFETLAKLTEKRKNYKSVLKSITHTVLDASDHIETIQTQILSSIDMRK